ncbi:outer membrane beta-barrel protein [Neolewinella agarilytica]|uniref:Outer membrane protein beta-barrel domain-containing protein n=1 Tax=Neolewinella agarilytica TaxID=478744 RepID=A0A1H9HRS1_9BACT|nr:outer membrane beta-barrel protein [Neolewinella agarilytica]SEQ64985.1 Outer membrane protein beta-barrel domain-containing protein [Neolewinella agarilytica]
MRHFLLLILPLAFSLSISAQEFSGGFRAGLNFISFSGDQEMSSVTDATYETFNRTTGFHVGATFALAFTDLVGIKADLMYSQKGGEIRYEGPSYFYLYANQDDLEGSVIFGDRSSEYDVVNSFIDIPLTAYYRLGPLEIEGGLSAAFMVNSRVSGGATYNTNTFGIDNDIVFNVDGNYFQDRAGGGGIISRSSTPLPRTDVFPPDVISAYYNSNSDEKLYRRLDFAAVIGLSFYLNNGLFIGARYQHGLTDATLGENDLRITNEDLVGGREFNTEDTDNSRVIQASVGFRF